MQLASLFNVLLRWWWLLILAAVVGGGAAHTVSQTLTPQYRASAVLLVVDQEDAGVSRAQDLETSAQLTQTFSELITLRPVIEEVQIRGGFDLSVGSIRNSIGVQSQQGTQFLRVTAVADDPILARDIANVLSEVFIGSPQVALTTRSAEVTLVEPAIIPGGPFSPNVRLNVIMATALAVFATFAVVLLVEILDDGVKSHADILALTGLSSLGSIPKFGRIKEPRDQLELAHRPTSIVAEGYRTVRSNLTYALNEDSRVVLTTSARPGEGKTSTVANLAFAFASAGHKTIVVDADLRRPTLHQLFGLDNHVGLTNLLLGDRVDLDAAIRPTAEGVALLSSGPAPNMPSELLGSPRMDQVLGELRTRYDIVLIDSPPVLDVSDTGVLTRFADAVVIVVRAGRTRSTQLTEAVQELARTGCVIAGVVLNRDRKARSRYSSYYAQSERQSAPTSTEV